MLDLNLHLILTMFDLDTNLGKNFVRAVYYFYTLKNLHAHVVKLDFAQNPRVKNRFLLFPLKINEITKSLTH